MKRLLLTVATLLAGAGPWTTSVVAQGADPAAITVVELYTSQGCSSCPAADALFKTHYAERPGLLALTLPVDVWDYLGWRDTLASPKFSERQRAYARALGNGKVYTPQVVINGQSHVKGGMRTDIDRGIEKAQAAVQGKQVRVKAWLEGKALMISVPAIDQQRTQAQSTVWVAVIQRSASVVVKKGDNGGRTLVYANVVRDLIPVGSWSGAALTVRLEREAIMRPGADACAILLQSGTDGPIVGATMALAM